MLSDNFILVIEGLKNLDSIDKLPSDILRSARIAVNHAATRGRTDLGREVLSQVNLPASYVAPNTERLYVSKRASSDLEAVITARSRQTSLARFLTRSYPTGFQENGVVVRIQHGVSQIIGGKRGNSDAFVLKLKGRNDRDSQGNLGVAIRTKNGLPPSRAWRPVRLRGNLWLLYGPSVSQIILSAKGDKGAAVTLTPHIQDMLEDEFYRQMGLS